MAEGDSLPSFPNISLTSVDMQDMWQRFVTDGDSLVNFFQPGAGDSFQSHDVPFLEILEQPKQRGFRFRYSCEGPSHGGLPGERSAKGKKSYPSVQINNYYGRARIEVTLVTSTDPPKPHAHSLVGKHVQDGACVVEIGPDNAMTASFPNLGIQHVTKKNVKAVLKDRHLKSLQLQRFGTSGSIEDSGGQAMKVDTSLAGGQGQSIDDDFLASFTNEEMHRIEKEVEEETKNMNLSIVRLCFQTYLPDEQGHFRRCLAPVYSQPIFDSKAPAAAELKICRIDRQSGFVNGGEEVFLLCDKVQKDDIEVRFFEVRDGKEWEDFGKFSSSDVHRQFAIVFKTPPYWDNAIERSVTVQIELRRKSDKETSPPIDFVYKPTEFDPEQIGAKRRKKIAHFSDADEGASTSGFGGAFTSGATGIGEAMGGAIGGAPFFNPALFNQLIMGGAFPFGGAGVQQQFQPSSSDDPS